MLFRRWNRTWTTWWQGSDLSPHPGDVNWWAQTFSSSQNKLPCLGPGVWCPETCGYTFLLMVPLRLHIWAKYFFGLKQTSLLLCQVWETLKAFGRPDFSCCRHLHWKLTCEPLSQWFGGRGCWEQGVSVAAGQLVLARHLFHSNLLCRQRKSSSKLTLM